MSNLRKNIETAINCASAENGSNTLDFILAEYLTDCLASFDKATQARENWCGRHDTPGTKDPYPGTAAPTDPAATTTIAP